MSDETHLTNRVRHLVADAIGFHVDHVRESSTFESLKADSLDVIELAMALEDRFVVEIADDEIAPLKTVDAVVRLIRRKLGERAGA